MSESAPGALHNFKDYIVTRLIASGGIGELYRAWRMGFGGFEKLVAIKLLSPQMADDAQAREMFLNEARLASQFSSKNIVQVYDLGSVATGPGAPEDSGPVYFHAKEYVMGSSLGQMLERLRETGASLAPINAAYIALCVAQALEYAHNFKNQLGKPMGVIHRSVSTNTILVSYEGEVKLTDFSAARGVDQVPEEQVREFQGLAGYMSPEQVRGYPLDGRSDIFSLGVVFWELLAGRPLFTAEDRDETLRRVAQAQVEPPSSINPQAPSHLERICLRCLQAERGQRYPDADSLVKDLENYVGVAGMLSQIFALRELMLQLFGEQQEEEARAINQELHQVRAALGKPAPPTKPDRPTPLKNPLPRLDRGAASEAATRLAGSGDSEAATRLADDADSEAATRLMDASAKQAPDKSPAPSAPEGSEAATRLVDAGPEQAPDKSPAPSAPEGSEAATRLMDASPQEAPPEPPAPSASEGSEAATRLVDAGPEQAPADQGSPASEERTVVASASGSQAREGKGPFWKKIFKKNKSDD